VNVVCQNNGVCRSLILNYTCECLGDSYSGRHCEITSAKVVTIKATSKSLAAIAIIAMTCVVLMIVMMDLLKYVFGVDTVRTKNKPVHKKKPTNVNRPTPVAIKFTYVHHPSPSSDASMSTGEIATD
jgi:hypothetical protein